MYKMAKMATYGISSWFLFSIVGCTFWLKEFDEVFQSTTTIVVLHITTGWEIFQCWETLNFDISEFVGSGIRLGDNNVGVILRL